MPATVSPPPAAAVSGHLQPFAWALRRLGEAFSPSRVRPQVAGEEGAQVIVDLAAEDERQPYRVILRDPVLGNVNRQADPGAWLEAEIAHARAWFAGESQRRRTFG